MAGADTAIERRLQLGELRVEQRNGQRPVIRGYAAVFEKLSQDLGGFREQIVRGAFREAIQQDDVRALIDHLSHLILGRNTAGTLRLSEDAHGLAVEIDPPDTQYARDLVVSMKRGDITQMSFGFSVRPGGQDWAKDDAGQYIRTLKRLRLFDVSPVTYPAYPQTSVAVRELQAFQARAGGKPAAAPRVVPRGADTRWRDELRRRRLLLDAEQARCRAR